MELGGAWESFLGRLGPWPVPPTWPEWLHWAGPGWAGRCPKSRAGGREGGERRGSQAT